MENREIKVLGLRILKYLSKHQNSPHNTFSYLLRFIGFKTRMEFDAAISYLNGENFIKTTTQIESNPSYNISPQGIEYIIEFDDFELKSIFDGFRDYAILKFLYEMNGKVYSDMFPESILTDVPTTGKGMDYNFYLRSYIEYDSSLKKYVIIDNNDGSISLNSLGRKYYEHLQDTKSKDVEIRNKPLVNIDLSTHTTGDNNIIAPHSDINKSFNKNEESPQSKEYEKKSYGISKKTLTWTIITAIVAIITTLLFVLHVI